MTEYIDLIRSEIHQLTLNLERAKAKPGVRQEEIQAIEHRIRLKTEILGILERMEGNNDKT